MLRNDVFDITFSCVLDCNELIMWKIIRADLNIIFMYLDDFNVVFMYLNSSALQNFRNLVYEQDNFEIYFIKFFLLL